MKKFLSYFLSFTLLINLSAISCTFATNDETSKDQKIIVATESKEVPTSLSSDNNKLSDEELKNQIIKLMENGEIKIPHKTVLDILYKILGIPLFLLKAILISAGSILSMSLISGLIFCAMGLSKISKITDNLKDSTENIKSTNFNINISDSAACTAITTILIPMYEILQIPLPNKDKYVDFCLNLIKARNMSEFDLSPTK